MVMREEIKSKLPWYVSRLPRVVATIVNDPVESFYRARTRVVAWKSPSEPFHAYTVDQEWRRNLRGAMGMAEDSEFSGVWAEVLRSPELAGLCIGPQTFGIW